MRRPNLLSLLVLAGIVLLVVPSAVTYYTDWLWCDIHAQIPRDLEMPAEPFVNPGVVPAPDLIQNIDDILQSI